MAASIFTVAFEGAEARRVEVQVQILGGNKHILSIVGLADKAVAESRERVRSAFAANGLKMPYKRMVVNLAPADLPKEGAHYDLPIALGIMAAMGALPTDALHDFVAMGELSLDGTIAPVPGALPAAVCANSLGLGLICPEPNGAEAAWAGDLALLAPHNLVQLINHFKGRKRNVVAGASFPRSASQRVYGRYGWRRGESKTGGGVNCAPRGFILYGPYRYSD